MMPQNLYEWLWLGFFVVGSIGGWAFIGTLIYRLHRDEKAVALRYMTQRVYKLEQDLEYADQHAANVEIALWTAQEKLGETTKEKKEETV